MDPFSNPLPFLTFLSFRNDRKEKRNGSIRILFRNSIGKTIAWLRDDFDRNGEEKNAHSFAHESRRSMFLRKRMFHVGNVSNGMGSLHGTSIRIPARMVSIVFQGGKTVWIPIRRCGSFPWTKNLLGFDVGVHLRDQELQFDAGGERGKDFVVRRIEHDRTVWFSNLHVLLGYGNPEQFLAQKLRPRYRGRSW